MTARYGIKWGAAELVHTKHGDRMLQKGPASSSFWKAWRSDKAGVKNAGFSVTKNGDAWIACYWGDLSEEVQEARVETTAASYATGSDIELVTPPGMDFYPFQRAGVAFALDRPGTLIGDEMGLGKTMQAIGVINASQAQRVLLVVKASLIPNWIRELGIWLDKPLTIEVAKKEWPLANIVIVSYDSLHKFRDEARKVSWDLVIADEAHLCKNDATRRAKALFGHYDGKKRKQIIEPIRAKRKILMTGTAITNRPSELFSLLNYLDPIAWKNKWKFFKRYCDAHDNGFGWDTSGASNLDELHRRLRETLMIRRKKADVLKDLPPKTRQVLLIDASTPELRAAVAAEKKLFDQYDLDSDGDDIADELVADPVLFSQLSKIRHLQAVAKVPLIIDQINEFFDESNGEKLVVMSHHLDVAELIRSEFSEISVKATGETSAQDRDDKVQQFQTDPATKLFIGSIQAMGVGITLTAASTMIFAELDWVPGNVTQAEDRIHRIGQENAALIQHVVINGTIDARMVYKLIEKQKVIDRVLDGKGAVPAPERPVYENDDTKAKAKPTVELTDAQEDALRLILQALAANDSDHATVENGVGFNGLDTHFGCSLAAQNNWTPKQASAAFKVAQKYKRQSDPELYTIVYG